MVEHRSTHITCLLQEDNGTAYLLTSSQVQSGDSRSMILHQLSTDYRRPLPDYVNILPGLDRESPVFFKYNELYFLLTSGKLALLSSSAFKLEKSHSSASAMKRNSSQTLPI